MLEHLLHLSVEIVFKEFLDCEIEDRGAGVVSDTVYPRLAVGARVVICGTASISSWDPWPTGPRIERHLLVKRARAQGFVILDYMDRWEASVATLADWVR